MLIMQLLATGLAAQSFNEIKASTAYLWGEGQGKTLVQADKRALKDLISQISVQVESDFSNIVTEAGGDVEEYTKLVLSTYSATTLNQALRKVKEQPGETIVLRYIEKVNISKLFENRRIKLLNFLNSAQLAEKDFRIGDALKYYYWTLVLLRSHPDVNTMQGSLISGEPVLLISYLPEKIENLFNNLNIAVQKVVYDGDTRKKTVILHIQYQGTPVSNLDYIYYTGDSWTNRLSSCRDGLGLVEYFGVSAKALKDVRLKVEYTYASRSKIDIELKELIENADLPYFSSADVKFPLQGWVRSPKPAEPKIVTQRPLAVDYSQNVAAVIQAIDKSNFEKVKNNFTEDGKSMFIRLLQYGHAELIDPANLRLQILELNDRFIVRSVPMKFSFPNNNREFIENVVFSLNKAGKIDDVSFALSNQTIKGIMGKGERFGTEQQKQQIVHFMEDYKTAYCLERLDYIESVFADNALILVGNALQRGENIDSMYRSNLKNEDIQFIKLNKTEYIDRLRNLFATNEFVNIHFEETEVKKVGGDDQVYGIQLAQNYNSMSYADFGYLFLMFDLNNVREPKIYVRSWQPERNAEGRIMGLEDFTF